MPKKSRKPAKRNSAQPSKTAIVKAELSLPEKIENVLVGGDLAVLTVPERLDYYKTVCKTLGLNPFTRPLEFIVLNGKMTLYARKDCTEQLRRMYDVGVVASERTVEDGLCMVKVKVQDKAGKTDIATGAVYIKGLVGLDLANAIMKAETKAKRRATLSICGLGFLDESEVDDIDSYGLVTPGGRIMYEEGKEPKPYQKRLAEVAQETQEGIESLKARGLWCEEHNCIRNGRHSEVCESSRTAQKTTEVPKPSQAAPAPQDPLSWKKDAEKKADEAAKPKAKKEPPKPIETKYELVIDWSQGLASPILTGDVTVLGDIIIGYYPDMKLQWGADGFWHADAKDVPAIMQITSENAFLVREIHPGSKVSSATQRGPAPEAQGKPERGRTTSGAAPASGPTLVVGVIHRVTAPTTSKGQPMRQVTILTADQKKPTFGCFIPDLYEYLDKGKGAIEAWTTVNGKYFNLVGLKSIVTLKGKVEFDSDGKTVVIQNRDREAGGRTLF